MFPTKDWIEIEHERLCSKHFLMLQHNLKLNVIVIKLVQRNHVKKQSLKGE